MGSKGLKGRKKEKLKNRRDLILKEVGQVKRKQKNENKNKNDNEKKQLERLRRDAVIPYHPKQRILILGDGDFSFTRALLNQWTERHENVSSSGYLFTSVVETKEDLYMKYPKTAQENVKAIRRSDEFKKFNVEVLTRLDATEMEGKRSKLRLLAANLGAEVEATSSSDEEENENEEKDPKKQRGIFDRIIFNFPHLGTGETDTARSITLHQQFLVSVAVSCHEFLSSKGELHITIKKGEPYRSWKVSSIIQDTKLYRTKTCVPFFPSLYPGYEHKRTVGAAFKGEHEGGPEANADINRSGAHTFIFCPLPLTKT